MRDEGTRPVESIKGEFGDVGGHVYESTVLWVGCTQLYMAWFWSLLETQPLIRVLSGLGDVVFSTSFAPLVG